MVAVLTSFALGERNQCERAAAGVIKPHEILPPRGSNRLINLFHICAFIYFFLFPFLNSLTHCLQMFLRRKKCIVIYLDKVKLLSGQRFRIYLWMRLHWIAFYFEFQMK